MSNPEDDIEKLLADILDDSKPLPTQVVSPMDVAVATEVGTETVALDNNLSDQDFLESLMNDVALPTPKAIATPAKAIATAPVVDPMANAAKVVEIVKAADKAGLFGPTVFPDEISLADEPEPGTEPIVAQTQAQAAGDVFADSGERAEGAVIVPIKMPTFAPVDFAQTIDIRNFATLVTLTTSRWHAKVKDRQASKDAAKANDADENSFETRKNLLVGADASLRAIHKILDQARASHYEMTVPWTTTSMQDIGRRSGGRLLANTLFVDYTQRMGKHMAEMKAALNVFEPLYPDLIEAAKKKLGKRFDRREYPNVSDIRNHFGLSFDFEPIPKGDDFKGLPQAQLDALARKLNDNMRVQAEHALQDIWIRLHESVGRMAERLASPDKIFHDTLTQNVRDTARLMAHMNVTNDARIEDLRKKVEKHLCQHEPKELRTNQNIRRTVAAHAKSIIEQMDAYGTT